jgi:hypothetical protein
MRGAVLVLVALATPAAAAAQAPDERAAARAFADSGIRLAAFFDGSEARFDATGTTRRTPAMRRASRALDAYARAITGDFGPRLDRAIERLQELGVPRAEARAFDGETDDDRYAPAPSSTPTAPRAAS